MLNSIIKRYYQSVSLLNAYTAFDFLKQGISFPFDYYLRAGRSSYPLNITLALTLRCNARCSMCALTELLDAPQEKEELSLKQYKELIDFSAHRRPGFVLYGGEPFLRKDILDIVRIIKNHRLSCGIFTNGLLLNKDILREIIDLKVNFVAFSLYGPKAIHDKIVGVPGAYEKIVESASFLKKNRMNTKVIVHCTVSAENIKHLKDIAEIDFCDSVRFGHLIFITENEKKMIIRSLSGDPAMKDISLKSYIFNPKEGEQAEFSRSLNELRQKRGVSFTPELNARETNQWYSSPFSTKRKCLFIWRGVFIGPNGDVYPCMGNFSYKMGNIINENLGRIWNNKKYINLRLRLKKGLLPVCARCCRL